MEIRKYQAEDLEEIVQLFYETIQTVNRKDYSQEQVEVWSNRCENLRKNKTFFEKLYTVVAVEGEKIIGYGNIDRTGYLDHLFVHKDFQNQGVATAICDELEQPRNLGFKRSAYMLPLRQNRFLKDEDMCWKKSSRWSWKV